MTPTPPTERDLLALEIDLFVLAHPWWSTNDLTDHLIASGWVRWDEAQAVCRNTAHDALHDAIYEINECARVQSAVDEALVALTPPKGGE